MRGKAEMSENRGFIVGITPAYAGKSKYSRAPVTHTQDHPRLCGEKPAKISVDGYVTGSPPPMRGKGIPVFTDSVCTGITPAYAGKSHKNENGDTEFEDHPRLCGEKTKKITKQRYFFHQPASFSFSLQYT